MKATLVLVVFAVAVAVLCTLPSTTHAIPLWGPTGHEITAQIGQQFLGAGALKQINSLLANVSGQMYLVSDWADQILSQPQWSWSAPLHYINTPDWACTYVASTDCVNNVCVAGAIKNYTDQIASSHTSPDEMQDAIRFVIHFHGDIHQPLHVAFGSDKGGNTIEGTYYGSNTNLHEVWDSGLINTRIQTNFGGSQNSYVNYLLAQLKGPWHEMADVWAKCNSTSEGPYACPAEWASESANVACNYAYVDQNGNDIKSGFSLADPYFEFASETLDQQLCKGGIRLAATLNNVWPASAQ